MQQETGSVTLRLIAGLVGITLFFSVLTIIVLTGIIHNYYEAAYYTAAALFDAVGIGPVAQLGVQVPLFSLPFNLIVAISIVDGLVKIMIIGFFLAALISIITSIDLGSRIGFISKNRMKNHIIICGYTTFAEKLVTEFVSRKVQFVITDKDAARADEAREAGFVAVHGDFTKDVTLNSASIKSARAIIFLTHDDYDNLLGVITARHLNDKIKIIALGTEGSTTTKMHRAGAELCVVPQVLAGIELGEAIVSRGRQA